MLFILSGPSGSGKSTVLRRVIAESVLPLRLSVSATTRQPRKGERDGVEYHFWSRERFESAAKAGAFLEWAEVHGNLYGTPLSEVASFRLKGMGVILDIDVQGAAHVRLACPDAVSIFLRPSSLAVLEERLRARKTETEAAIQRRLEGARRELERIGEYQYVVVNDELDKAVAELLRVVQSHFERNENA